MSGPVVLARVVRSGVDESVHLGSVAVADVTGEVVARAGDPTRPVFARSASKPLQAAVCLDVAAARLGDAEVAVMAASHNGEPVHVEAVRRILSRARMDEDDLRCPPAWPLDLGEARRVSGRSPVLHDCSGKHAGMLLACRSEGLDVASYPDPGHPLQERITEVVTTATGSKPLAVGVDGCGVPVHRVPLVGLAAAYARLGRPDLLGGVGRAAGRVVEAMAAEPYLVAGRARVCTSLMEAFPRLVVKVGAEGIACAALLDRGIGVAVKVEDGAPRAQAVALVRALTALGAVDPEAPGVAGLAAPPVLGGGRPVGRVVADFELAEARRRS